MFVIYLRFCDSFIYSAVVDKIEEFGSPLVPRVYKLSFKIQVKR